MSQLNTGIGKLTNISERLIAVEEVVPSNRTLTTGVSPVDGSHPSSGGHSFVAAFTAPQYRIRISKIRMWLEGNGLGGAGTQIARGVVYAGVEVAGLPAASLVAQGTERTVTNPSAGQLWEFSMPTTALLEANVEFSAGVFFNNIFPSVNQAMTIPYANAATNSTLSNNDTYADGAVSPFGTITAGYPWLPLIEVDVESAPSTYDEEIAELDDRLDVVEDTLAGGVQGGASTTIVETATPLAASDVYYGQPVDCSLGEGSLGRLMSWRARTDQVGTNPTMEIQESADSGATWYPIRRPDGYSAIEPTGEGHFTGELTGPSLRVVRIVYYNGGTIQGSFELVRSLA